MLAKKRYFTEFFPFEAYHKSEKLELTKKNEYDFGNQHPKNYLKANFLLLTLNIVLASVIRVRYNENNETEKEKKQRQKETKGWHKI